MESAKVLVVDDEDGLRTSIGMILEHAGFQVVLAPNVPEALEAICIQPFDVVLSDLRMPGPGDGMTVIRAMHERYPQAVKLLMSATIELDISTAPLLKDDILRKPFQMQDVITLIRAKLARVD